MSRPDDTSGELARARAAPLGRQYDRRLVLLAWGKLRITDSGDTLSISPYGIPMSSTVAMMSIPMLVFVSIFVYGVIVKHAPDYSLLLPMFLFGAFSLVLAPYFVRRVNRMGGAEEPIAVLNRPAKTLVLCDEAVSVDFRHVRSLTIRGRWSVARSKAEVDFMRLTELFIEARLPDGTEIRRRVVACGKKKQVRQFAEEVSRTLGTTLNVG